MLVAGNPYPEHIVCGLADSLLDLVRGLVVHGLIMVPDNYHPHLYSYFHSVPPPHSAYSR
jgi:hypothetical protein